MFVAGSAVEWFVAADAICGAGLLVRGWTRVASEVCDVSLDDCRFFFERVLMALFIFLG